jgi:hypothetical protein
LEVVVNEEQAQAVISLLGMQLVDRVVTEILNKSSAAAKKVLGQAILEKLPIAANDDVLTTCRSWAKGLLLEWAKDGRIYNAAQPIIEKMVKLHLEPAIEEAVKHHLRTLTVEIVREMLRKGVRE